jgi:hypothetical protein
LGARAPPAMRRRAVDEPAVGLVAATERSCAEALFGYWFLEAGRPSGPGSHAGSGPAAIAGRRTMETGAW